MLFWWKLLIWLKISLNNLDKTLMIGLAVHCEDRCNEKSCLRKEIMQFRDSIHERQYVIPFKCFHSWTFTKLKIIRNNIARVFVWNVICLGVIIVYANLKKYSLDIKFSINDSNIVGSLSMGTTSNFLSRSFSSTLDLLYSE